MLFWLLSAAYSGLERVLYSILVSLSYLFLAIAVGHYCGWIERWIWFVLEKEASKVVNGAKVTLGSFRLDWSPILQGKIIAHASNAVLHTPQRQVWGWESPLIARVGKATVEVNAPITIVHELFLRTKLPLEIYSIYVSDVQVFVERHDQVVNVYLCDPAAVLPPPPFLAVPPPLSSHEMLNEDESSQHSSLEGLARSRSDPLLRVSKSEEDGGGDNSEIEVEEQDEIIFTNISSSSDIPRLEDKHKEQAQKLVNEMLQAVQSLGRAAQKGSLHTAVKQHGLEIAERLRDGLSIRNRNTSSLEQGVALMEQVGKVAVESFKAPKLILPERKVGEGGPKPPMARVGRIVLKDARVFTKDSWIQISHDDDSNHKRTKIKEHTGAFGGNSSMASIGSSSSISREKHVPHSKKANWNRPIYIETLVVRASELCPPMSLKDEQNPEFPSVYQPLDKIVEIVWRRLLAEMAKSDGGRLFSTALGEVLSFIKSNPQPNSSYNTNSTAAATTRATTSAASTASTNTTVSSKKSKSTINGSITKNTEDRIPATYNGRHISSKPPPPPPTKSTMTSKRTTAKSRPAEPQQEVRV